MRRLLVTGGTKGTRQALPALTLFVPQPEEIVEDTATRSVALVSQFDSDLSRVKSCV